MLKKSPHGSVSPLQRHFEDDIDHILRSLDGERIVAPRDVVVSGSLFLRKWIVERGLERLARELNVEMNFSVQDNRPHRRVIDNDGEFGFYTAGGVMLEGTLCGGAYAHKTMPAPSKPLLEPISSQFLSLREIKRRRPTYYDGEWFSTEDIIRFAAHKYGGAHLDDESSLTSKESKYLESVRYMTWGGPPNDDVKAYSTVHRIITKKDIEPWNCCHIEILSLCQSVISVRFGNKPFLDISERKSWLPWKARRRKDFGSQVYDLSNLQSRGLGTIVVKPTNL